MYNASEAHGITLKGRNIEYRGESILASEVFAAICKIHKNAGIRHNPARMMVSIIVDSIGDDSVEVSILTYQQFCNLSPYIVRSAIATLKK